VDMPVTIASLDVDAAAGVVGGEEHRRLPAAALPTEQGALRRVRAAESHSVSLLSHRLSPPLADQSRTEHMFYWADYMDADGRCQERPAETSTTVDASCKNRGPAHAPGCTSECGAAAVYAGGRVSICSSPDPSSRGGDSCPF
jgi:hypothetical protein